MKKLHDIDSNMFFNFYDGSKWKQDASQNNGPTVFEAQRLWMYPREENPLMFNDELKIDASGADPSAKYYPSTFSWRFYRGSGDVNYKVAARDYDGNYLTTFKSDDKAAIQGKDVTIKKMDVPYNIAFDIAPVMTIDEAKTTGIMKKTTNSIAYPLKDGGCSIKASTNFRFYGCDKWVSRVHKYRHDWSESLWKNKFVTAKEYFRNPLTDSIMVAYDSLTDIAVPQSGTASSEKKMAKVDSTKWNAKEGRWDLSLSNTDSDVDKLFAGITIEGYKLISNEGNSSGWETEKNTPNSYIVFNKGTTATSTLEFYRAQDSIFWSSKGLNNGNQGDTIPLARVVSQSSTTADAIFSSPWAKNVSATSAEVFKRRMLNDTTHITHPYLTADYDSASRQFAVNRNSTDIYASREDEIITLRGSIPYKITDWKISYIQNGMRFKVAEGTKEPIEGSMNVNKLQGNTSFFLTYNGVGNYTYYRQLDVHIGDQVKAGQRSLVNSMYGNVSVAFDERAWKNDVDVTVRTMDPNECYDCDLFRNMAPVGPVLEVLPSHVFPEGHEPIVTVDISMAILNADNVDYQNLKIYKLDTVNKEIVPLEIAGSTVLLNSDHSPCNATDAYECAIVRINAKTPTFSEFVVLDSLKADSVRSADSIDGIEAFSCAQMDTLWMDTLWMGTANGWLEYPYLCTGKSNYLLQLSIAGNVSAEHRGASATPIVWSARNSDFYAVDSAYQSSIVFYGIDGNTEQKLGPTVRLDSVAPVIENVDVTVFENEDGSRTIHVETEIDEVGSGIAKTTVELFFGGSLLRSENALGNMAPIYDFKLDKKDLYSCVGCRATIKVIAEDKGHNSDMVVKQSGNLYPFPSSLVLWYPLGEGSGKIGYEVMTKDSSRRMHMDLSAILMPWNGRYGVRLYAATDSASSLYKLPLLDSLRPFSFEFNYTPGYERKSEWTILSFVGKNEWTFGIGSYNRYYLKVGSKNFYFKTMREPNASTHFVVVVNGKNVSLYKNGNYVETIKLDNDLFYGGSGRLSIGRRNGVNSAVGNLSNLRFYSSALTETQVQSVFSGVIGEENFNVKTVRAVSIADRNGLIVDQSCSAPGKAYLRQNTLDNSGTMTWSADLNADNYSLYLFHRNYISEESRVEVSVDGTSVGIFKLTSTGLWKNEKIAGLNRYLTAGTHEISIRPMGNLGIAALALVSTGANLDAALVNYNESSWKNPDPKATVLMKYEPVDDRKWAQVRFNLKNKTDKALENARIRYYYKGEGENVNAVSFYPGSPMSVANDAGSVFYAEFSLTEAIEAYGTAYFGQGPLIGLHRLTSPNNYFPYWDISDDPSYLSEAETEYVNATGIALLDSDGNLLNEFACYDEDGPMQKAKVKVRAMAKDIDLGSNRASNVAVYVENVGTVPVDGFEVRYYFRDTAETKMDTNWNEFSVINQANAGGDLNYVSFLYDIILNSGDKSDYGNGVQFALHHPGWTNDFNAEDDPSHHNLERDTMMEADSIVILDKLGNLLWGNAPQPRFNASYETRKMDEDLVHREGNVIYVNIESSDYYILETVNAIGIPQKTLFKGSWDVGEHSLSIDMNSISPSSFIVLRKGSEILSWKLLN